MNDPLEERNFYVFFVSEEVEKVMAMMKSPPLDFHSIDSGIWMYEATGKFLDREAKVVLALLFLKDKPNQVSDVTERKNEFLKKHPDFKAKGVVEAYDVKKPLDYSDWIRDNFEKQLFQVKLNSDMVSNENTLSIKGDINEDADYIKLLQGELSQFFISLSVSNWKRAWFGMESNFKSLEEKSFQLFKKAGVKSKKQMYAVYIAIVALVVFSMSFLVSRRNEEKIEWTRV